MGFEIRVNGQAVHTVDIDPRLVIGAHIYTPTGEVAATGFSLDQNFINVQLDYQQANTLEVMEDDARLAKAAAVQNGDVVENLYPNENARREEALKALAVEHADQSANSTEDLSAQFGQERQKVIEDSSIMPPGVELPGLHPSAVGGTKADFVVVDEVSDFETSQQDRLDKEDTTNADQEAEITSLKEQVAALEAEKLAKGVSESEASLVAPSEAVQSTEGNLTTPEPVQ